MCACVLCCPLRFGAAQCIVCAELVRSEERVLSWCTAPKRSEERTHCPSHLRKRSASHDMDPALLHRMNDLIMSRRISPQLFVSHLQDSAKVYMSKVEKIRRSGRQCVEYRDRIRELERENSLLRAKNSGLERALKYADEHYIQSNRELKVFNSILTNKNSDLISDNRGLELLNNELESQLEYYDNPEDDACDTR